LPGFFAGVDGTNTTFLQCLNDKCLGGGLCEANYTGVSCASCVDGLVLSEGFVCNQCPQILEMLGIVLVCMAALVGYLLYRREDSKNNVYTTFQVFSKISISTFQVNSLAMVYAFDWSAAMESLLAGEQAATSVGVGYLELQCFYGDRSAGSAFLTETLIYLFTPLVLALIIFVAKRFTPQVVWARYAWLDGSVAVLLFLLQPSLVERCAMIFSCVKLGRGDTDLFMTADLSVRCWEWSGRHGLYIFALGLPLLILYVVGFPVGVWKFLMSAKNQPKVLAIAQTATTSVLSGPQAENALPAHTQTFADNYGFLFLGYKSEIAYWEVVVMLRKIAISLIGVIVAVDFRLQGMSGMLVVIFAIYAQLLYTPFVQADLNLFEFLSLCSSMATFYFGIFTLDAGANGASIPASSVVALVVNSVYLFAVVVWGVKLKLSQREKLLAQQKAVQLIEFGVQSDEKTDEYGIEMQIVGIPPPETPAAAPDNKE